ncbi:MAG: gliding motility lipoprotein GldH [Bacteroidales bacterium]|nr:gliding motility lipoprotein GldH [Bacteroidales bacterium]
MIKFLLKSKVALLCFLFIMCTTSNVIYHSFQSINPKGWEKQDTIHFSIPIETEEQLLLEIEIRHITDYKYKELKLALTHNLMDSTTTKTDSLSITLANDEGRWKGIGIGSIFQIKDTLCITNRTFPGNYKIDISHLMQKESIPGIHDIGVRITTLQSPVSRSINSQKDK